MKTFLILMVMILSGCMKEEDEFGTDEYFKKRPHKAVDKCIERHLGTMAIPDHVEKWDAELYKAVCDECEKLYLKP
jgi:hypothetical protein